ncbi:SdiA-regulated domain-containing protein [bacterium]|nr:SdiA-regulated domain-containing protein [bacterium]
MLKIIVFLFFVHNFVAQEYKDLSLLQSIRIDSSEVSKTPNFSGLTNDGKNLYTVSDRKGLHSVYQLKAQKSSLTMKAMIYLDFPKEFLDPYAKSTKAFGRIDLEGICFAQDRFYIVNETMRDVLSLGLNGEASLIRIPFDSFHKSKMNPFSGMRNAGLEAISCNNEDQKLYLFNERQFRMIYEYDLNTHYIQKQFSFSSGNELPKSVSEDGSKWMYPDFAGSHYEKGILYVLVRNRRMIVKYDLEKSEVLERRIYKRFEDPMYQSDEPFGLAEGLTILNDKIYIIFDNNSFPLKATNGDTSASLLVFKKF